MHNGWLNAKLFSKIKTATKYAWRSESIWEIRIELANSLEFFLYKMPEKNKPGQDGNKEQKMSVHKDSSTLL